MLVVNGGSLVAHGNKNGQYLVVVAHIGQIRDGWLGELFTCRGFSLASSDGDG